MGFAFLLPLFLAGLAALAIPVAIHLTQRPRSDVVRFPTLRFLRQSPFPSVRRQRIRDWPLFAIRAAVVALLALAFARPFLPDRTVAGASPGREVVILLDRSFSMGAAGRWSRATDAAREVVRGLGPEDRATVVVFDDAAEAATAPGAPPAALLAAIDSASPGAGRTRYEPAITLAARLLGDSPLPVREAILVSDFQRVGWDRARRMRLPPGAVLIPRDVGEERPANLAVVEVRERRSQAQGREAISFSARVAGEPAATAGRRATLTLDGRDLETIPVALGGEGSAVLSFRPVPVPARPARATIRLTPDALPMDDQFHVVVTPSAAVPVLHLVHPARRPADGVYLRQALALAADPAVRVTTKPVTQATATDFTDRPLVILEDAPLPEGAAGRALRRAVADGGRLWVVLGSRSGSGPADDDGLLPGTWGAPVDRLERRGATIGWLERTHPVFEVFRGEHGGDLSAARFFRYRRLALDSAAHPLARFDDGGVALAERRVGRGVVLLWASPFDNTWSDLPVRPIFLPLVHQGVRYLAGSDRGATGRTVGQVLDLLDLLAGGDSARADEVVVQPPSGRRISLDVGGDGRYLPVREAGFYAFRSLGGGEVGPTVAANADRAESNLESFAADDLAAAVLTPGGPAPGGGEGLAPEQVEQRQGAWWYLLLAVLLLMLGETVLAGRRATLGSPSPARGLALGREER